MDFDSLEEDKKEPPQLEDGNASSRPLMFDDIVDDRVKYSSTSGTLKAAALGAARSASLGLSDQLLTKTGLLTPEEIKRYEEVSPYATGLGEFAGVFSPVGPIKAVGTAGKAVATGVGEALGAAKASGALGKILSEAAALGAGSSVEGAAFGLGQAVSEDALGDHELNAEKLFSHIGEGALVGLVFGSGLGAIKGAAQTKFPKILSEVDRAEIDEGKFDAIFRNSSIKEEETKGIIKGLTKLKPDSEEIVKAAKALDDAPVLPSMISDSEAVKRAESTLIKGDPTYSGLKAQGLAKEGYEKAQAAALSTLGEPVDLTKSALGDTLKNAITARVEENAAPIKQIYDELKANYKFIPLEEKAVGDVIKSIENIEGAQRSSQARKIIKDAVSRLKKEKTVDDIKSLKTIINEELSFQAAPIQKRITSIIADKLTDLEEGAVVSFAEKQAGSLGNKERILALLDHREAANAQYSVFKDKLNRLGSALGKRKVYGPKDFIDFLENLTDEKVADKLSAKNNSEFLDWFSKELPDAMNAISAYQKGLIRESANKSGYLNVKTVINKAFDLPEEYRSKIFSPENIQKLKDVKKYIDAFPKDYNPSGTASRSSLLEFFASPGKLAGANIRDFAAERFIKSAVSDLDESAQFVSGLSSIEKGASSITKKIVSGVRSIFADSGIRRGATYVAVSNFDEHKNDKLIEKLKEVSYDPGLFLDNLTEGTNSLYGLAPKITESIQQTSIRAIGFLSSKIPGGSNHPAPMNAPYKPSKAELYKFDRYVAAVKDPTIALKQVESGSLTPETMEVLESVYPKMLESMRLKVSEDLAVFISKKKMMPYAKKLNLSMFLGSDLVSSLSGHSLLSNQNALRVSAIKNDQILSANKKSLSKMGEANRLLTPMQRSAQRKD